MNNKCTPIKKNDTNDLYIVQIIAWDIKKYVFFINLLKQLQSFSISNHEILIYYTNIDDKVFMEFKN